MANSIAQVCMQTISGRAKKNLLLSSSSQPAAIGKAASSAIIVVPAPSSHSYSKAVAFKYKHNLCQDDIEEIRRLLTLERAKQAAEVHDFYTADYERLMDDDWLVTRFLLRGIKVAAGNSCSGGGPINNQGSHHSLPSSTKTQLVDRKTLIYVHTMKLIEFCAKFRYEYRVNSSTGIQEFPNEWTSVNGLFNYKPDFAGNPTIYLRVELHRPKLIENERTRLEFKRYMLYTLEQGDQDLHNQPGKAICCVFDMTNVSLENIDLELTSWMIKSFKNCGPKLLGYVIVYNPPWFFTATFKLICNTLLSNSKRQSVKFVYGSEILDYIAFNNLPQYIQSSLGQ